MSDEPSVGPGYSTEQPARDEAEVRQRHAANRESWNEAAEHYTREVQETIDFLNRGGSNLHPIERANLGDLRAWCRSAIHLQCASGRDTLSLWNEGVERVVGVDISDVHIANARQTSEALGAPAEWYRCDVLDTPHTLDGQFDLVYTGRGALCWLHDLNAWAGVIFRLLNPGGVFHILDDHPVTWLFDADAETLVPSGVNYFTHAEASRGWSAGYLDDLSVPDEQQKVKHERLWPLSSVFQALTGAGLTVEFFGEHAEEYWNVFPYLRDKFRGRLPLTFSMRARKPLSS